MCITRRCRVNNCKDGMNAYFANDAQTREAAKFACQNDHSLTPQKFLCGGYIDVSAYMLARGVDPCPGDSITFDSLFQPWEQTTDRLKQDGGISPTRQGVYLLGAIALILLLRFITK